MCLSNTVRAFILELFESEIRRLKVCNDAAHRKGVRLGVARRRFFFIGEYTGNGMKRERPKNGVKRYPVDVDADEARCYYVRLGVHVGLFCICSFTHHI